MELKVGGRRAQPCCVGVGLAEQREGSMVEIGSAVLETGAGRGP
jgi:hypothetical protein